MNALALILATTTASAGVDYGWQPTARGDVEYIIQIEPSLIEALKRGEEITSEIPPELAGVRRFRIRVGTGFVPRIPPNPTPVARAADTTNGQPPVAHPNAYGVRPDLADQLLDPILKRGPSLGHVSPYGTPPPTVHPAVGPLADGAAAHADAAARNGVPNPWAIRPPAGVPQPTPETHEGPYRAPVASVSGARTNGDTVLVPSEQPSLGRRPATEQPRIPTIQDPRDARNGQFGTPAPNHSPNGFQPTADPRFTGAPTRATGGIQPPSLPPRPTLPETTRAGTSDQYTRTQSDMMGRFQSPARASVRLTPSDTPLNPTLPNTPQNRLPGFANGTPNPATGESMPSGTSGMAAPGPIRGASFDEPTTTVTTHQMERPSLPETANQAPYKPWGWLVTVLFGFLISVSANFYLGWIAWDIHRRYRTAVLQLTDAAALGV